MSSTSLIRSGYPSDWSDQPPPKRSRRREGGGGFSRFVLSFGIGVGATLAWQAYGDTVRQIVAGSYPQLGWLAPRAAAAQTTDAMASAAPGATDQEIKALSLSLAAMRQRVDQLAAQIAAGQDQMTRDISARVQAAQRDIMDRIATSQPRPPDAATAARKPTPASSSSATSQLR
jgi:hypothetical protein